MKISYISDLHLDFWCQFNTNQLKWESLTKEFIRRLIETDQGQRDVVCINGDISHFNIQSLWALNIFSQQYSKVFVCLGNHDLYLVSKNQTGKYKNNSWNRVLELQEFISQLSNVHLLLDDEVVKYNGVKFGGNTMWYPVSTIEQQVFFNNISNDSRLIKGVDINLEHEKSIANYNSMMQQGIDVMISHVPLCHLKSHEKYGSSSCYYTPVDELPPFVIQGHSHERAIYKKAGSLLYMNCLGYPHDGLGEVEIRSFEI